MRAVYAASMAKRGFTGPRGLFEGQRAWSSCSTRQSQSIGRTFTGIHHADRAEEIFIFNPCQPVLEATLDLKRSYDISASDVERVRCDIFKAGFDFAGGGIYGPKDHVWLKEQGDYNLKYLISAALLDGEVGPAQLDPRAFKR